MPFDGANWSAALVPAISYQPDASFGADVWFGALATAYAKARTCGRLIATYAWPWNGIYNTIDGSTGNRIYSNSLVGVAAFDCWVESTWTHAVAYLLCSGAASGPSYLYSLFGIDDGVLLTTEPSIFEIPAGTAAVAPSIYSVDDRNEDRSKFLVAAIEQAFDEDHTLDADLTFYLNACATDTLDTSPTGLAMPLRPFLVALALECRG